MRYIKTYEIWNPFKKQSKPENIQKKYWILPNDHRLENSIFEICGELNDSLKSLGNIIDTIESQKNFKYVCVGTVLNNNKPISTFIDYFYPNSVASYEKEGYKFSDYINLREDEIKEIEFILTANKYNL